MKNPWENGVPKLDLREEIVQRGRERSRLLAPQPREIHITHLIT
jgi:hypothetical protein